MASRGFSVGWPNCDRSQVVTVVAGVARIRVPVDRRLAVLVGALVAGLERARAFPFTPGWCWGYACRPIGGTSRASEHSKATAVDLDAPTNPMRRPLTTNMPAGTAELAARLGFTWGGLWSTPDPMHFEFAGTPQDAARIEAELLAAIHAEEAAKVKVRPQFPVPLEPIVAECRAPGRGAWAVAASGALYALGDAPWPGGLGLNRSRHFRGRQAARIMAVSKVKPSHRQYRRNGYKAVVTATSGERYGIPIKE